MEYEQIKVIPEVLNVSNTSLLVEVESTTIVDGQLLSNIVGAVSEVDLDEATLSSLYELRESGQKSKSSSEKKPLKRVKTQNLQ
jgi:hypothetical protein